MSQINPGLIGPVPGSQGGSLVLVEQHTAASSANLSFTTGITAAYDDYVLEMNGIQANSSGATIQFTLSTNAGGSFSAATYYYAGQWVSEAAATGTIATSNGTLWTFHAGGMSTAATDSFDGFLKLKNLTSGTLNKVFVSEATNHSSDTHTYFCATGGEWRTATAVNAFQIAPSAGGFAVGTARLYGVAKS